LHHNLLPCFKGGYVALVNKGLWLGHKLGFPSVRKP
jgi:hypothetical protein